jgi:hypothetical protein
MSVEKMQDDKLENRSGSDQLEAGFGGDDKAAKTLVFKMDVRYVYYRIFGWNALLTDDCRILPVLALLFLCSFIDRTNVGNAKILGLEDDINITDYQYSIGLCVFYATYIARLVAYLLW